MPVLWKAKQPYNVNVAATVAGLTSLAHRGEIQAMVDALIAERERIYRELAAFPCLHPYPSAANFVLARFGDRAIEVRDRLRDKGILVRDRSYEMPGCVRITVGTKAQLRTFLEALAEILG